MGKHVLVVTWDGGGNINPAVALAAGLAERGHGVTALGPPTLERRFVGVGAGFLPREEEGFWDITTTADDVAAACERVGPDAAVVDYMLPAALCATEARGVTTVALVHTLYAALLEDGAPSPIAMAASIDGLNQWRHGASLPALATYGELLDRAALVLVTAPEGLDVPLDSAPANVRHVGPLLEGPGAGWAPPWPDDDRPLVVVSLGTTPMEEAPVVQRVLTALAGEPVRVLAMLGAHLDGVDLDVPPNATVTGYVPHAAVLPRTAVVVCHGGLGTVLAALAAGVPCVCLPLGREQPANAEAVARVGAGAALAPDSAPDAIRAAVRRSIDDPATRAGAEAMAVTIAGLHGAPVAAVEALLTGPTFAR